MDVVRDILSGVLKEVSGSPSVAQSTLPSPQHEHASSFWDRCPLPASPAP
jgi:hypothetical protein